MFAPEGGKWSALHFYVLPSLTNPITHWIGDFVDPRAILDSSDEKNLLLLQGWVRFWIVHATVYSRYPVVYISSSFSGSVSIFMFAHKKSEFGMCSDVKMFCLWLIWATASGMYVLSGHVCLFVFCSHVEWNLINLQCLRATASS